MVGCPTMTTGGNTEPACRGVRPGGWALLVGAAALVSLALASAPADADPSITMTSPTADLSYYGNSQLQVSGHVEPAGSTVSLNGGPDLADTDGDFYAVVPLQEGPNHFTLQATDTGAAHSWFNFTVVADFTPPALTITAPNETETTTNRSSVDVKGHVEDESGNVTVSVSGRRVPVDSNGSFSYAAPLSDGLNVLLISAQDAVRNEVVVVRTITFDRYAPFLTVDSPAEGTVTRDPALVVRGRTERDARVDVNGQAAFVDPLDGSFEANVTVPAALAVGDITLTIRATDRAGNVVVATRTVHIDLQAPSIVLDLEPWVADRVAGGLPVNNSTIKVRGQTDDAQATVRVASAVSPLDGLSFERTIVLTDGLNIINISAADRLGNTNWTLLAVRCDRQAPSLVVTTPDRPRVETGTPQIRVRGTAGGEPSVTVRARYMDEHGQESVELVHEGGEGADLFAFEWTLDGISDRAEHRVSVEAVDPAGNTASFQFTYIIDPTNAFLEVVPPARVPQDGGVWVNGTTSLDVDTVTVGGEPYPVEGGRFAVWVALEGLSGWRMVNVSVTNALGDEVLQSFSVYVQAPALPDEARLLVDGRPLEGPVPSGKLLLFSLEGISDPGLTVVWTVDGTPADLGTTAYTALSPGVHNVTALVEGSAAPKVYSFRVTAEAPPAAPGPADGAVMLAGAMLAVGAATAAGLALRERRRR